MFTIIAILSSKKVQKASKKLILKKFKKRKIRKNEIKEECIGLRSESYGKLGGDNFALTL